MEKMGGQTFFLKKNIVFFLNQEFLNKIQTFLLNKDGCF